jgi:hypothetical protein
LQQLNRQKAIARLWVKPHRIPSTHGTKAGLTQGLLHLTAGFGLV